jgi:hypothetical protein
MFWYKSIILLVDAHKLDFQKDKDAYDKCVKILKKSIELVAAEKPNRKNKHSRLTYIEAMLSYHLAELTCEGLLNDRLSEDQFALKSQPSKKQGKKNSMHHTLFKRLSELGKVIKIKYTLF